MTDLKLRRVERKTASGEFEEIKFADLKKRDEFKLYDPEGIEPRYEDGSVVYTALTDPVPEGTEGNYGVKVYE
jgi:hypothetical protein